MKLFHKRLQFVWHTLDGQPVAFMAELSANLVDPNIGTTVVFDNVHTNVGDAYKPGPGVFISPLDGVYCVAHQRNAYLWLVNWMHLVRWQCIVYSTELLFTLTFSVNMYHSAIWLAFYVHTQLNLQHAIQNKKCTNKTRHYNQIVKVSNYSKLFTTNNLRIIPRLADVYRLKLW